jgi:hypothetical protein
MQGKLQEKDLCNRNLTGWFGGFQHIPEILAIKIMGIQLKINTPVLYHLVTTEG